MKPVKKPMAIILALLMIFCQLPINALATGSITDTKDISSNAPDWLSGEDIINTMVDMSIEESTEAALSAAPAEISGVNSIDVGKNSGSGTGWYYQSGVFYIGGDVTITGTTGSPSNNNRILISGGSAAKPLHITLQKLRIATNKNMVAGAPIVLASGSHVVLRLDDYSTVTSKHDNYPGIQTTGAYLTIEAGKGEAKLEVDSGYYAAAIGGVGYSDETEGAISGGNGGTVTINSGDVTANGTYGAGIGGGKGSLGYRGDNASYNPFGNTGGTGGWGGLGGSSENVIINGGTVTAISKYGAGIGGGSGGKGGTGGKGGKGALYGDRGGTGGLGGAGGTGKGVTVNGGTVTAKSTNGAGIGGGQGGSGGNGGQGGNGGISNGSKGYGGSGGMGGNGATVTINGGTIREASTGIANKSAAIGGGSGGGVGNGSTISEVQLNRNPKLAEKLPLIGNQGIVGSCRVNLVHNHEWRISAAELFTRYPDRAFPNNNTHRYVEIKVHQAVEWDDIKNKNISQDIVKTDLNLISSDAKGAKISWVSNNGSISPSGKVIRPEYPADDARGIIEANISYNGFSDKISFDLNVPTWTWDDFADTDWYTAEQEKTFLIGSARQLAGLARLVNTEVDDFAGKTLILTDDIDLSLLPDGASLTYLPWEPIGTEENPFRGEFNGNGHIINGLRFVNNSTGHKGLFGWNFGRITHLGLSDLLIEGSRESGGIAAINGDMRSDVDAAIENCFVLGNITADKSGGLAGKNDYGAILNGYFFGEITGAENGGIAGTNYKGSLENLYYSEGIESAVGAAEKGARTSVGWFTGIGGELTFSDDTYEVYENTLLESLNVCAEIRSLGFDWISDPEVNGGCPIFDPDIREDRVAAASSSHTIIVKDYKGHFVEGAEVSIGESHYITNKFGTAKIDDEMLFGVNRIYVKPLNDYRKGEAYYLLLPGKSRNLFLEEIKNDGKPYITMATDTISYTETRSSSLSFIQYKGDMLYLQCSGDWNGNGSGVFMLYQSGGKYIYSDENGIISLAPGLEFEANKPIWLKMIPDDESKNSSDYVPLYIRVISSNPKSDFEKSLDSVDRAPNFTATPRENGEVDGDATETYPETVKLPTTVMSTLSSAMQSLDGTITFHGYIGDFSKGAQLGFSVGGMNDAYQLLSESKDKLKVDLKSEYNKLKAEWVKEFVGKATKGAQGVTTAGVQEALAWLDDTLKKIYVPEIARSAISKQLNQLVQNKLKEGALWTADSVTKLFDQAFDFVFDLLDGTFIGQLLSEMNEQIDIVFDELMSALKIKNLVDMEKSWNGFKSDFQAAKRNIGAKGCLDTMKSKYSITEQDFTVIPGVVSGSVGGIGYFEVKFDMYGRQLSSVGEVIVSGYAQGSKTFTFSVFIVPVSIEIGGGLGLGAAVKTMVNADGGGVSFDGEVLIGINPFIWLSAGVGVKGFAYLGVRGDAGLHITVFMKPGQSKPATSGKFTASAKIEAEVFLIFKDSWRLKVGSSFVYEKQLWGEPPKLAPAPAAFSMFSIDEVGLSGLAGEEYYYEHEGFDLVSRDYLTRSTAWNGNRQAGNSPAPIISAAAGISPLPANSAVSGDGILQSGVLPGTVPIIAKAGDQTVMIFQADDGVSPTGDHIRLMYSVLTDGVWSEPIAVWDTQTSDFFAKTLSVDNELYLIWQKSKAPMAEEISLAGAIEAKITEAAEDEIIEAGKEEIVEAREAEIAEVKESGAVDAVEVTETEIAVGPLSPSPPNAAAYAQSAEPNAQEMLDTTLANLELCFAKWDTDSQGFVNPDYITNNEIAEMNPILAASGDSITALWIETREGDPFGGSGLYAVVGSTQKDDEWSMPVTLFETTEHINELAAGYAGDELQIAYSIFGEEDIPDIWLRRGEFNVPISHAKGGSGLRFFDGKFYWQEEGSICSYDDTAISGFQMITAGDGLISGSYKVLDGAGKKAIVWAEPNPGRQVTDPDSEQPVIDPEADQYIIRASLMEDGVFGPPITLRTVSDYLANFDAVISNEGNWQFVMNTYQVVDEEDTDHALGYLELEPRTDIALKYIYASTADAAEGMQPLDLVVTNQGETTVKQVQISLSGHETLTGDLKLAPGETVVLKESVDLGKLPDDGLLCAEVTCAGDSDPSNNVYELNLGLVDVAVELIQERVGSRIFLTAELSNRSLIETETMLVVRENDENGNIIDEAKRFIIGNRNNIEVFYQFDVDMLADHVEQLYLEAITVKSDVYQDNNWVMIPLYREHLIPPDDPDWEHGEIIWTPAEGISIVGENTFYIEEDDDLNQIQLEVEVYPENANNQDVSWVSSDQGIAYVGSNGLLTLRAPGKTTITAITKDGKYRDSMEITVNYPLYRLGLEDAIGGYVKVDGVKADEEGGVEIAGGEKVSLEAVPYIGYRFVRWITPHPEYLDNLTVNPVTFTMPDENTTVAPLFKLFGKNRILWSISVTPPDKTEYYEGESLNLSGMTVLGNFDEGDGYMLSGYTVTPEVGTPLIMGMKSVTVSYTEGGITKTASFEITVKEPLLQSITVTAPDQVNYIEEELLSLDGLVVTAHYTNGSREVFDYVLDPDEDEPLTLSHNKVTVSYTEEPVTVTDSFEIKVLKRIRVTKIDIGNNQVTLEFSIHSANGKGYVVYVGEATETSSLAVYNNWNANAKGVHITKLTKGKTYCIMIAYTVNGVMTERSELIEVTI
ncbi:MAG: Ig-like domain-containing protein [Clostridiales bacterium]|jgi:hypothetical protein|nr:Ig-like domain-containing protein [Clostridiales bacterium]